MVKLEYQHYDVSESNILAMLGYLYNFLILLVFLGAIITFIVMLFSAFIVKETCVLFGRRSSSHSAIQLKLVLGVLTLRLHSW